MSTFGDEFLNAAAFGSVRAPQAPPDRLGDPTGLWNTYTRALNLAINELMLDHGGGYLYFPPGNYFLTDGIVIHPTMTVIFAPNAVLTMPDVGLPRDHTDFVRRFVQLSIHIRGGIQAGLHQIVAPTVVGGVSNGRAGLLFETDTIREVYPEWWGAVAVDIRATGGFDSHAGIQSAIDAAIHNRQYGGSIPIKLTGRYQVSAPLRIGGDAVRPLFPASSTQSFVVRGVAGPQITGSATLASHPTFPAVRPDWADHKLEESSLLIVRGPAGFLIENVAFDASESVTVAGGNVQFGKVFSC